jgi:cytochrome c5
VTRGWWLPLLAAVSVSACSGERDGGGDSASAERAPSVVTDTRAPGPGTLGGGSGAPRRSGPDGATVYRDQGCIACHGNQGQGTFLGPPITGMSAHWTRDDLAEFFADPARFVASTPRLAEYGKDFGMRMPALPRAVDRDARLALADWVLAR